MEGMCYTYILKCSDGTYYTGWTNDLDKRLQAHNSGKAGAKYTRNRRPVALIYYEEFEDKKEAMRREYAIKQLTRKEKEALICAWKGAPDKSGAPKQKAEVRISCDVDVHENEVAGASGHYE